MNPERAVNRVIRGAVKDDGLRLKYGTVPPTYAAGQPQVQFDGESSASERTYPHLSSYTPAANDRVALLGRGQSWLIIGKVPT